MSIYPVSFVVNVGFYDLSDSTHVTNVLIHTAISVKVMMHKLNALFITSLELSCKLEDTLAQLKG